MVTVRMARRVSVLVGADSGDELARREATPRARAVTARRRMASRLAVWRTASWKTSAVWWKRGVVVGTKAGKDGHRDLNPAALDEGRDKIEGGEGKGKEAGGGDLEEKPQGLPARGGKAKERDQAQQEQEGDGVGTDDGGRGVGEPEQGKWRERWPGWFPGWVGRGFGGSAGGRRAGGEEGRRRGARRRRCARTR